MRKTGRKSAAELSVVRPDEGAGPRLAPPAELDPEAARLWREIVATYPAGHFTAGDLVLLREFCFTAATLLPEANARAQKGGIHESSLRNMHVKTLAMLAAKLRLNVAARMRADTAKTRDAARPIPAVDFDEVLRRTK